MSDHPYLALFRAMAVHQALWHKDLLGTSLPRWDADTVERHLELIAYNGLWLTKLPLLYQPRYDIARLDRLVKGPRPIDVAELCELILAVDADVLRFVLSLGPEQWEERVELFFGGRALNKPLWNLMANWFEHAAALRGTLHLRPDLFSTAFL